MSDSLEQDARIALLDHYTSQLQGYKVNLLTIAVGFFAGVEALKTLDLLPQLFPILAGAFVAAIAYCFAKILLYGQHAQDIIRKTLDSKSDSTETMLNQLDKMVRKDRAWWIELSGSDSQLAVLCVFIWIIVAVIGYVFICCSQFHR